MALTTAQLASKLFKKLLGKTETSITRQFFEETINTYNYTPTTSIWLDYNSIPTTAPILPSYGISGVVQYISGLTLTAVNGAPTAFYDSTSTFKDIIPFNFDPLGSYSYTLKDSAGTTIPFADWLLDTEAGVLTFYNGNGSYAMPPKISFYKYVGTKSVSTIFLSASYSATDTYTSSYNLNAYSSNLLYIVNFLSGNTTSSVTLNVNSLGAKTIKKFDSATNVYVNLIASDIAKNSSALISYADGEFISNGFTYKCLQAHTSQVGWDPPNVPALWQKI